MIGQVVGGYTIVKALSSGDRGDLYLAEHRLIHRRAAVKILQPALAARNPEAVDRFFEEARVVSTIRHPGIVEIHDADLHDDRIYVITEMLEGASLAAVIDRAGSFASEVTVAAALGWQIASALAAAHQQGIVHRDLKPENVFLHAHAPREGGERAVVAKLLNFGLAALAGGGRANARATAISRTQAGRLAGSALYMSPEQCRGAGPIDARSDIYSFGCLLFELLTGRAPFVLGSAVELYAAHMHEPAPAPSSIQPGVPEALDALVAVLLAKDAVGRPASMEVVAERLLEVVGERRPVTSRKILASGQAVALALAPVAEAGPLEDGDGGEDEDGDGGEGEGGDGERDDEDTVQNQPAPVAAAAPLAGNGAPTATVPRGPPPGLRGGTHIIRAGSLPEPRLLTARMLRNPVERASRARLPPPAPARRLPWHWIALAAVVVAIVAVSGAIIGSPSPRPPPRVPEPEAEPPGKPVFAAPRSREPETVAIEIVSHPEGADAFVADESAPRGKTPLRLEVPRGTKAVELRLVAEGYVDRTVALDVVGDHTVEIGLVKVPSAVPPPAPTPTVQDVRKALEHRRSPKYYLMGD